MGIVDIPTPAGMPIRVMRRMLGGVFRRMRVPARSSPGAGRRRPVTNPYAGRNIRVVPYRPGENLLAPLPTILAALRHAPAASAGAREAARLPLRVTRASVRGWGKVERESMTLILLVDVSRSTAPHLRLFGEVLSSLAGYFRRNRDRMGLVAIQGRQATVAHYPTHNHRVVTRHLAALSFRGETPLADGLRKAAVAARMERFKNPGARSLVLLLSDCCPEPVTPGAIDVMREPAYREAVAAAHLYPRNKVGLLLLLSAQTRSRYVPDTGLPPGERLAAALVRSAKGRLIRLPVTEAARMSRSDMDRIFGTIHSMLTAGAQESDRAGGMSGMRSDG